MPTKVLNDIVLQDFIELALGSPTVERVSIPATIAEQIAKVDSDEAFCHIEWPTEAGLRPVLWRIEDWRKSYARHTHRKQLNELERMIWVLSTELRSKLAKRVLAATGLDERESELLVNSIVRKRNVNAAGFLSVDLAELIAADKALEEFKTKK